MPWALVLVRVLRIGTANGTSGRAPLGCLLPGAASRCDRLLFHGPPIDRRPACCRLERPIRRHRWHLLALLIWQTIHEAVHRDAAKGPRIVKVCNKKFGPIRNLTAVYITDFATPIFWFVRIAQMTIYPPLVWLVNLPPYNAADWVSVSRQKFIVSTAFFNAIRGVNAVPFGHWHPLALPIERRRKSIRLRS